VHERWTLLIVTLVAGAACSDVGTKSAADSAGGHADTSGQAGGIGGAAGSGGDGTITGHAIDLPALVCTWSTTRSNSKP
jgi:hypothetical protein